MIQNTRIYHQWQLYFHKIVAIILAFQGFYVMTQSILFIFIKIPQLEQLLLLDQVTQSEINHLTNKAIIMTISTILSFIFAIRITILQNTVAKRINTAIAVFLVIGNTQINNLLDAIGSTELITTLILNSLYSGQ